MAGLDNLLAKSLDEVIRKNLGSKTVQKIEDRLFEKFGISLTQAITKFDKLDVVLREFFGRGADGLETKFFESIFQTTTKKSKDKWYTLYDSRISSIILQAFGDPDKKKILECVSSTPQIISDILSNCDLPQTSGYRKINSLINDGLLLQSGYIAKDNKKINKYVCAFNNLKINIEKSKITIDVQLSDVDRQESTILQTIKI